MLARLGNSALGAPRKSLVVFPDCAWGRAGSGLATGHGVCSWPPLRLSPSIASSAFLQDPEHADDRWEARVPERIGECSQPVPGGACALVCVWDRSHCKPACPNGAPRESGNSSSNRASEASETRITEGIRKDTPLGGPTRKLLPPSPPTLLESLDPVRFLLPQKRCPQKPPQPPSDGSLQGTFRGAPLGQL